MKGIWRVRVAREGGDRSCGCLNCVTSAGWTSTETEIAQALVRGAQLDVSDRAEVARTIRAEMIRDLLLGRSPSGIARDGSPPDPRGLRLRGAMVIGRLDLDYLSTDIGLELLDCTIRDGITAERGRLARLNLNGSTLGHRTANGPALDGDGLAVTGTLSLEEVHAHSRSSQSTINLRGGHIGGELMLSGATITNDSGPALRADNLKVDQYARFDEGFTATGQGETGAIQLGEGHIGGPLIFQRATITNESGPALDADRLIVDSGAFFDEGFTVIGHGEAGAIKLRGGHIGGPLSFRGATMTNESGPALVADVLTVEQNAYFDEGLTVVGHGPSGAVRLSGVVIKGRLSIDISHVRSLSTTTHQLVVDGMIYRDLAGTSWDAWLELLATATPAYAAQPYRQLAAITTAAGHDSDTRQVLMRQRRDQLSRAGLKRRDILWGRFTGFTLGYGYQAWRALVALLIVTLATALLMALPIGASGLSVKDHPDKQCSTSDRVVLGIDTALPLVTTPVGTTCVPRMTASGQVITGAGVTAQILGWAFATLFVAGFTSAVRKT